MILSVVRLARLVKNFIDARSGAGKEELLNYFADWCNISQGDFELVFSNTINLVYNHNQIESALKVISKFMEVFEELFTTLNKLDYIGKKRDGSVFVSELNTDSKSKRSRTFLAD